VASGLVDGALEEVFGLAGEGEFDEGLLRELVAAGKAGDALLGKVVFESGRAGCAGCHRVGEAGGVIGPDLSAVGSGILPERIVTEVMWPARQVKEGYSLSQLTLQGGRVVQGYEQGSRGEAVLLRDFVSGELEEIASSQVVSHERVGSLMPATAQGLSREELGDLLAYLFGLRGSGDR
ncbi:MAG: c-type cytochrome, partial [Verrucomicrobiales bacterium]|nr:c-type cytochrome [Verrucomicrobiales bacterium]